MTDENTKRDAETLHHLGNVLEFLADLSPSDRCPALDNALAFYNSKCPEMKVSPSAGFVSRLVQISPLDWPIKETS